MDLICWGMAVILVHVLTENRYESFVLAPGESKVEVEIDTRESFPSSVF